MVECGCQLIDQTQLSRWRPSPIRAATLLVGAWLFGAGEALLVAANLGNSPWTVLAQGASVRTGLSIGVMTNVIGLLVLALWIPLRQRPGLGTVSMVLIVGMSMDITLACLPQMDAPAVRLCAVIGGIVITAIGTGLYLGSALGPGPRDGLMTGLHRVTGLPLGWTRAAVEIFVLVTGYALGGTAGVGTVVYALFIGPAVHTAVRLLSRIPTEQL